MRASIPGRIFGVVLLVLLLFVGGLHAQNEQKQPKTTETKLPQIADEPRTIDPALQVPPKLAATATVDFADSSLREVAQWIQDEQKIPVLFDSQALLHAGILVGEPVSDHLNNEPIYLLLNRLRSLEIGWYVEDDILHLTSIEDVSERWSTKPHSLGDLLDAGYDPQNIIDTITSTIEGPWESIDGEGAADPEWLGDVLFARQTDQTHREIAGFMAALRKHGRQTFSFDPPQHITLREKLNETVSVKFSDTPLIEAVRELVQQTGADIRLDTPALREVRVRDREPVSLILPDRKLKTVLHVLLSPLDLQWDLRDGVIWITSTDQAEDHGKTAFYDVRDLCRNKDESAELEEALENQTGGPWSNVNGAGGTITFIKPGTMVVSQTEKGHGEVLDLLATYRTALLDSKRRDRKQDVRQEVITRYYRLNEKIASDLRKYLPQLVQPNTWQNERRPEATGQILHLISSVPAVLDARGEVVEVDTDIAPNQLATVVPRAVLVIRQTRAVHEEIAEVVGRIEQGDPPMMVEGQGLGGGGGGFGGGFFSIQKKQKTK